MKGITQLGQKYLDIDKSYQNLLLGNGKQLTNMDEFRAVALEFKDTGSYTSLVPNPSPRSQYYKFWKEEARKCIEGYHTGYDYIPGYYYWYLNYSPILLTKELDEVDPETGLAKAERILDFPAVWDGDYYYYHYINEAELSGEHAIVLKTRGRGFSFKGGSKLARNYFLFPSSKSYAFAHQKEYLTKDGLLTKAWDNLDWVDTHTPWTKKRQFKDQDMHKKASYAQKNAQGTVIEKGYKSEIIGVTFNDNPDAARGKRGKLILWEEFGSFPHALKSWRIALNSMKQGRSVFGLMVGYGTGGEEGADFEAMEEMFSNPKGYQIKGLTNVLDEGRIGANSGFFSPEFLNREGFYDSNGNSRVKEALQDINKERQVIIENSNDPMAIVRAKAEMPIIPQEAMLRTAGTKFPVNDLMARRTELEANPEKYGDAEWIGDLLLENGEVIWKKNGKLKPVLNFPIRDNKNMEGCIQIFEPPILDDYGDPRDIYIAGTDPYDHDESGTNSLGCTFVMNVLTERIVAEYTGRPATAEEYYENVRRLCLYYGCKTNYENNLKGMYTYFKYKDSTHLLLHQPKILRDISANSTIKRNYGTPGTASVNKYARELIKSWLLNTVGDKMNIYYIRSIPLLKELELWNPEGNFDRVSALGMLMIHKLEKIKMTEEPIIKKKRNRHLTNDNFLTRMIGKQSDFGYNSGKTTFLQS